VVAIAILGTLIVRSPRRRLLCTGFALILGGALGNLIDRFRYGQVVDFLDFHAAGWHWPAFNVADSAISIGAVLLIVEGFMQHEGRARAPS
jgi:signal peptidase II